MRKLSEKQTAALRTARDGYPVPARTASVLAGMGLVFRSGQSGLKGYSTVKLTPNGITTLDRIEAEAADNVLPGSSETPTVD